MSPQHYLFWIIPGTETKLLLFQRIRKPSVGCWRESVWGEVWNTPFPYSDYVYSTSALLIKRKFYSDFISLLQVRKFHPKHLSVIIEDVAENTDNWSALRTNVRILPKQLTCKLGGQKIPFKFCLGDWPCIMHREWGKSTERPLPGARSPGTVCSITVQCEWL